jgi:hypothetical protein
LLFRSESLRADRTTAQEALVYLERPHAVVPSVEQPTALRSSRVAAPEARTVRVPPPRDTSRATVSATSPKSSAIAEPAPIFLPSYRPRANSTPSPFDLPRARNPFLSEEPRTRAEMDSILMELRQGIPLFAATRTPTSAERDSLMRERSREGLVPGRAAQIPGSASGSIGLPLFSAGPSAAERRRDSSANAEYVARLRRLQARVSASRELLRVADSMSRRRTP